MSPGSFLLSLAILLCGCAESKPHIEQPSTSDQPSSRRTKAQPVEDLLAEDVLFGLRGKQAAARACFERNSAEGLVRVGWLVEPGGEVTDVEVLHSTLGDSKVEGCLTEFVGDLHYPRRDSAATASWTFVRGVGDQALPARTKRSARAGGRAGQRRSAGVRVLESSDGRLAMDEIENVADYGFRLYAFCMREGLNRNLRLSGRVLLNFTIDPEGYVTEVSDAGSDLPDPQVIDCVAEAFYAMHFPKPEGGSVRLEYPILLNQ